SRRRLPRPTPPRAQIARRLPGRGHHTRAWLHHRAAGRAVARRTSDGGPACRTVRKLMKRLALLALIAMSGLSTAYAAEPVELATFRALARPAPPVVLQYGTAASQAVDLFVPTTGNGPHRWRS